MRKNYIILVLTVIFAFSLRSQNLPYLNASAGNANQSIVDKDTNLYMFHGSRLEKVNKNLTPIWVNTYSNINFSNILLSKTGAIYFIAQNKIGKINVNGGLDWVSTLMSITTGTQTITTFTLKQLLLDRNNNLVITGAGQKALFIKLDTSGNIVKTRVFSSFLTGGHDNFNVINDSLGNYKIYSDGVDLGGRFAFLINYSEAADSVNKIKVLDGFDSFNSNPYGQPAFFLKSKFGSNFYVATQSKNNIGYGYLGIRKYNVSQGKLSSFGVGFWFDSYFGNFNEDEKGNVLLSGKAVANNGGLYQGCEILDSNCVRVNGITFLSDYLYSQFPLNAFSNRMHVIHSNNYYFDALGTAFLSNPLTVSSLTNNVSCYANMPLGGSATCTTTNCSPGQSTFTMSTKNPINVVFTPFTSTVTSIPNFSIVQNYCQILDAKENKKTENIEINIYPNPFRDKVTINHTINTSIQLEIYNTLGGILAKKELDKNIKEINLEEFPQGIYFVKIIFDNKFLVKKLIKE